MRPHLAAAPADASIGSMARGCAVPAASARGRNFLGEGDISVSFEFFPPKTAGMEALLWRSIRRLAPLGPANVAVTYGAGGATRERTHATIARILKETDLTPAAHLTCIAATRAEIEGILRGYWRLGVRHIVALRGDPPTGPGTPYRPTLGGYKDATALVKGIMRVAPFTISVAAHPEKHPESPSFEADLDRLKAKIDAGAGSAITQFFFDNRVFLDYLNRVRAAGISIPIVPGIMPIYNFRRIARFSARAGISIPSFIAHHFEGLDEDRQTQRLAAAAVAAEQVLNLVDQGITQFHFYTLNRADLVYAICHLLGLRPARAPATVESAS